MKKSIPAGKSAAANERLRRRYRPDKVRVLFVGESPPASGRFFYAGDSGLYRAVRHVFLSAIPALAEENFLASFRSLGCYLVDLCGEPVDQLGPRQRTQACVAGEARLRRTISKLDPDVIVTLVRSIAGNVRRSQEIAHWKGERLELPYPGRWKIHRETFAHGLTPVLRRIYRTRL